MVFVYQRQIYFGETDAAGVLYFTNALAICHEAYEVSLMNCGIDLKQFFGHAAIAVPITHASIDYRRPSYCGDQQHVHLRPTQISNTEFEINYQLYGLDTQTLGSAKTCHVSISTCDRKRVPLTETLQQWIKQYDVDQLQTF